MGRFFVDTASGHVATLSQLQAVGIDEPEAPWHPIQGPADATTLWQAILVKREKGIFIGTITLRHGSHHALLIERGWQEIEPGAIGTQLPGATGSTEVSPSPWTD